MIVHRVCGTALAAALFAMTTAAPAAAESDGANTHLLGWATFPSYPAAAAAEKVPKYWVFGTELPAPPPAPKGPAHFSAPKAPDGKYEQFDYPGEYAQRFDGVDKGGKNETITIHGRYDLTHRLHRSAPRPATKTR